MFTPVVTWLHVLLTSRDQTGSVLRCEITHYGPEESLAPACHLLSLSSIDPRTTYTFLFPVITNDVTMGCCRMTKSKQRLRPLGWEQFETRISAIKTVLIFEQDGWWDLRRSTDCHVTKAKLFDVSQTDATSTIPLASACSGKWCWTWDSEKLLLKRNLTVINNSVKIMICIAN